MLSNDLRANQLQVNADFNDFVKELMNSTPLRTPNYVTSHHLMSIVYINKGSLINKWTLRTAQNDDQIIRHMSHGC